MNASAAWNCAPPPPVASPRPSSAQTARRRWFATSSQPRLNEIVGQLFLTHRRSVRATLLMQGVSSGDVDDVCTEVFVVALRRLPSFQGASSISTWLLGIARKLASDHRRSARVRTEVLVDRVPEQFHDGGPEQHLAQQERVRAVRQAVDGLRSGPRAVVSRYSLDEESMNSVAKEQRVPAQTAYARLYSAHASLRVALAPFAGH